MYAQQRLDRTPVERLEMSEGDGVLFLGDSNEFTVRAISRDGRWVICTRPVTDSDREDYEELEDDVSAVIYTVIDWDSGVRGPDNYHGLGYESADQIADALARFEVGDAEISVRSDVYLDIAAVRRLPA